MHCNIIIRAESHESLRHQKSRGESLKSVLHQMRGGLEHYHMIKKEKSQKQSVRLLGKVPEVKVLSSYHVAPEVRVQVLMDQFYRR